MFKSLRMRLIASYALISLLVVAALGGALILIVRNYYASQERSYLQDNAGVIGRRVEALMSVDTADDLISAQLQNMAFLSQVRIRLLDPARQVISDTGPWKSIRVSMVAAFNPVDAAFVDRPPMASTSEQVDSILIIKTDKEAIAIQKPSTTDEVPVATADFVISKPEALSETIYGFKLGENATYSAPVVTTSTRMLAEDQERSKEVVLTPLTDAQGTDLGYLEISEGPAYGQEIVNSVTYSLAIAAVLAILVAVLAGWWTSQWLSAPLTALSGAAHSMSQGDLSVRVSEAGRSDEFGELGRSFNQMAGSLQATILSLQRFVADAAHQIQTPITALRTDLELAGNGNTIPALQRSQVEVLRLQYLVDELLKLSRFEAGLPLQHQWLDLSALLNQLGETYAGRAEQHEQGLTLEVEPDVRIQTDEYSLCQALENLLDNALKFTPAGGEINLKMTCGDKQVRIQVEDSGPGIHPADMERLFERFYRGANAAMLPGSGLGLAIVRAAVEQLGGNITMENKAAGGACFSLTLPLEG